MRVVLAVALLSGALSGCAHYQWIATVPPKEVVAPEAPALPPDEVPDFVTIEPADRTNHFFIRNKSKEVIFVSYRMSVAEVGDKSLRLISGETTGRHRDRESPDMPIAPGSRAECSFYMDDDVGLNLIMIGAPVRFRIAIRRGENSPQYAVLNRVRDPKEGAALWRLAAKIRGVSVEPPAAKPAPKPLLFTTPMSGGDRALCYSTIWLFGGACWFIQPSNEERAAADKLGEKLFGEDAEIEFHRKTIRSLPPPTTVAH